MHTVAGQVLSFTADGTIAAVGLRRCEQVNPAAESRQARLNGAHSGGRAA